MTPSSGFYLAIIKVYSKVRIKMERGLEKDRSISATGYRIYQSAPLAVYVIRVGENDSMILLTSSISGYGL